MTCPDLAGPLARTAAGRGLRIDLRALSRAASRTAAAAYLCGLLLWLALGLLPYLVEAIPAARDLAAGLARGHGALAPDARRILDAWATIPSTGVLGSAYIGGTVDPEIAALAGSAGSTVVTLMATDAWERTRDGISALWRRLQPERADAIAAELQTTRVDVLAAGSPGDVDVDVEAELQAEWQGRVRRLLAARPDAAAELRSLLDELAPATAASPATQQATASGSARIYQAGRDQHITER